MQGVVIQGPTNYVEDILSSYKNIPNVVWSTWDNEPPINIELIKKEGIEVIQTPLPTFGGYLNINFQTISSYQGIKYLKSKGITEALKIRSDLKINKLKLFLELLKGDNMSFISICKPNVRRLYYELVYPHTSFDFPGDHLLYGSIDSLEKCFNFTIDQDLHIPPEALIAYSYLSNSNLEFKLDYHTFIKYGISFFAQKCLDNDIEINWIKRTTQKDEYNNSWDNLLNHSSDKNLYDY